jgi:hypothetical protein
VLATPSMVAREMVVAARAPAGKSVSAPATTAIARAIRREGPVRRPDLSAWAFGHALMTLTSLLLVPAALRAAAATTAPDRSRRRQPLWVAG